MDSNISHREESVRIKQEPEWQYNVTPGSDETNFTGDENAIYIDLRIKPVNNIPTPASDSGPGQSNKVEEEEIQEGICLKEKLVERVEQSEVFCKPELANLVKQEIDDIPASPDDQSQEHHEISEYKCLQGVSLKHETPNGPVNEGEYRRDVYDAICKCESTVANEDTSNVISAPKDTPGAVVKQEMSPSLPDVTTSSSPTPVTYANTSNTSRVLPHGIPDSNTVEQTYVGDGESSLLLTSSLLRPCFVNMFHNNVLHSSQQHSGDINKNIQPRKLQKSSSASDCGSLLKLKNHQRSNRIKHKCDICKYSAPSSSALVIHKRKHTGEKPFRCDKCTYAAALAHALVAHKRTHTGEKPYRCDKCSFTTAQAVNLVAHKRTHTGEKPYRCDKCPYAAAQASHLVLHKRTHTGEKPYRCDKCPYAATQAHALVAHKRTHTGEKPYRCDKCPYASVWANGLVAHKRTHAGEKPYRCDKCPYAAAQPGNLVTHKRKHTGEKP